MEHICTRSVVSGVSRGISAYGVEIREAVDALELRVCTDDLCEIAADDRDDLVLEVRAGILDLDLAEFCMRIRSRSLEMIVHNPDYGSIVDRESTLKST